MEYRVRVNGSVSSREERIFKNEDRKEFKAKIKSEKYYINGKEVTARKKYNNLKALVADEGWPVLDEEQAEIFDDLNEAFGAVPVDESSGLDVPDDSDRTESVHALRDRLKNLGACVTVTGDVYSRLKFRRGGVWRDVFSDMSSLCTCCVCLDLRSPYIFYPGQYAEPLESPAKYRAIKAEYDIAFPESEKPDYRADGSGLIPLVWKAPDKKSTKHAAIAAVLEIICTYYHALRDSNEPLQTNYFEGDNDNEPKYDDKGESLPPPTAAGEWGIEPSVEVMMKIVADCCEKRMVTPTDALIGPDYRLVPIDGPHIERDTQSRTVGETKRETAFATAIEGSPKNNATNIPIETNRPMRHHLSAGWARCDLPRPITTGMSETVNGAVSC
jgi:hypothetical protein